MSFRGVGFKHDLGIANQLPTNQQEADAFLESIMQTVSEFEHALLPLLDKQFPVSPDWFAPSD